MAVGSYSWLTFAQAKAALAQRLDDPNLVHWANDEIGLYLKEALTIWQALTGYSRARGTFNLSNAVPFYDITTLLKNGAGNLILAMDVTDAQVIPLMQYMLLETPGIPWTGTSQFNLNEFTFSLQSTRNKFLSDTGTVISQSIVNVLSPPLGRFPIDDTIIDVRRAAWLPATPGSGLSNIPLWITDEFSAQSNAPNWSNSPDMPFGVSIIGPPPLQLQLVPPPIANGRCQLLTVNTGAALDPAAGIPLGVPNNFWWAVKWGTLARLLSQDGEPRDDFRANYCQQRYEEACEYSRIMPVILDSYVNGNQVFPQTVSEFDAFDPTWGGSSGQPDSIACCGQNMVAFKSVPDNVAPYSAALDVIQNAVVPASDGDFIQIGREFISAIYSEAQHIAMFKSGGSEFSDSFPLHQAFMREAGIYNEKLRASSIYLNAMSDQSNEDKKERPRRETDTVGAQA